MATSSIFNTIAVNNKEAAHRVIDAMESAAAAKPNKVKLSKPIVELDDQAVQSTFSKK